MENQLESFKLQSQGSQGENDYERQFSKMAKIKHDELVDEYNKKLREKTHTI